MMSAGKSVLWIEERGLDGEKGDRSVDNGNGGSGGLAGMAREGVEGVFGLRLRIDGLDRGGERAEPEELEARGGKPTTGDEEG